MASRRLMTLAAAATVLTWTASCGTAIDDDSGVVPTAGQTTTQSAVSPLNTAAPSTTPGGRNTTRPPSTHTPRAEDDRSDRPISLSFAGDIHFEGQLASLLNDPSTAFAPIAEELSAADLTIVNLETAVGTSGTPEPGKRFTFQAPPSAFDALAGAGVDVVTMANNHALDFGQRGLDDTFAAIAAGSPVDVVGVGADVTHAFTPAIKHVHGTTIAVLGTSMADDPTADPTEHWAATPDTPGIAVAQAPERIRQAVSKAAATADIVVVYLHWGIQGEVCPSDSQTRMAEALAGAGADIVVGSHTHTLQGAGMLGDTFVAYGLGNFAWYLPGPAGLLTVTVAGGRVTDSTWAPAEIKADGLPEFTGAETNAPSDRLDCTGLEPAP